MPDLHRPADASRTDPALTFRRHPLADARPGLRYRICDLAFSMVRDRCRDLGLEQGDDVTCIEAKRWSICLEKLDGRRLSLERDYAWFVQVDAL